jgi:hypothetical protein
MTRSAPRLRDTFSSSAMLCFDSRTNSANGAWGRHDRHDSAGTRLVTVASGWRFEPAQINRCSGPARRTTDPQKPIARGERSDDRRRKQHRHAHLLPGVPGRDQALSIFQNLPTECATRFGFLCRDRSALALHPPLVEAHARHSAVGRAHPSSGAISWRSCAVAPPSSLTGPGGDRLTAVHRQ